MPTHLEAFFPGLTSQGYRVTSQQTRMYNCIAWAAGESQRWWWPSNYSYWPPGAPFEETISAFVNAFAIIGYVECADADLNPRHEKVAIYALNGIPTHAARQLIDGSWTSKCGEFEDISHSLTGLNGSLYGEPVKFLARERTSSAQSRTNQP